MRAPCLEWQHLSRTHGLESNFWAPALLETFWAESSVSPKPRRASAVLADQVNLRFAATSRFGDSPEAGWDELLDGGSRADGACWATMNVSGWAKRQRLFQS